MKKDEDKLNLPIIKKCLPDPEPLNMDDYLEFVLSNLKLFPPPKSHTQQKDRQPANVRFKLL